MAKNVRYFFMKLQSCSLTAICDFNTLTSLVIITPINLLIITDGFNQVFPMEKLHTFSPDELVTKLCGDQFPNWTRDDILNYTEPKQGYSKER
jgi:hypothetical protein